MIDYKHDMREFDRRRRTHNVLRFTLVVVAGMAAVVVLIELMVREGWLK